MTTKQAARRIMKNKVLFILEAGLWKLLIWFLGMKAEIVNTKLENQRHDKEQIIEDVKLERNRSGESKVPLYIILEIMWSGSNFYRCRKYDSHNSLINLRLNSNRLRKHDTRNSLNRLNFYWLRKYDLRSCDGSIRLLKELRVSYNLRR